MHKYIEYNKLFDFSEDIDFDYIYKDITKIYKLKNIDYEYEDAMNVIINTLLDDYDKCRINYKAFIEKGMDARVLFELRKNAYIKYPDMKKYCEGHKNLNTIDEIKQYRIEKISEYYDGYADLDWQYSLLISDTWGISTKEFYFDFDVCFNDCHSEYQRTPDDYRREFNEYIMSGFYMIMKNHIDNLNK